MTESKRPRKHEDFEAASSPGARGLGRLALRVLVAKNDSEVQGQLVVALEEDGLKVQIIDSTAVLHEVRGFEPGLPPLVGIEEALVPVVRLVGKTVAERMAKLESARGTLRMLKQMRERPRPSAPRGRSRPGRRPASVAGSAAKRVTRPPSRPRTKPLR